MSATAPVVDGDAGSAFEIVVLGTGAGATCTFFQEPSSTFALLQDGEPLLLCDLGLGVTASCLKHIGVIPPCIYISHNHTDHAGQLPVALAVTAAQAEKQQQQQQQQPSPQQPHDQQRHPCKRRLYAHEDVMQRLCSHRLAELKSTGRPLDAFATFCTITDTRLGGGLEADQQHERTHTSHASSLHTPTSPEQQQQQQSSAPAAPAPPLPPHHQHPGQEHHPMQDSHNQQQQQQQQRRRRRPDDGLQAAHVRPPDPGPSVLLPELTPGGPRVGLRCVRSLHSETCYGLVIYVDGKAVLGWTADSGLYPELYHQLAAAPVLLMDARAGGPTTPTSSHEHATFADIAHLAQQPPFASRTIYITGYGRQDEAPTAADLAGLPNVEAARPGARISLVAAS